MAKAKDRLWWLERHRFAQVCEHKLQPYMIHMARRKVIHDDVEVQAVWRTDKPAVTAADNYAHGVAGRVRNVLAVVEQMRRARMLMWLTPPKMAKEARLDRASWTDYHLATFTHSVVSALDCCVLLVAEVYAMGLTPRFCKLEVLRSHAFIRDTRIPAVLQTFNTGLQLVKERRNKSLHHGERTALDEIVGEDAPPDLRLVTLLAVGEDDPMYREGIRVGWRAMILLAKPKLDAIEDVVYTNVEAIFGELLGPFQAKAEQLDAADKARA